MKFIDWLETECQALERYDAMCRGEIPPGEVEFHKASGEPFFEFVEFSKDNDDGSRTTVIANAGGLEMFEKAQAQAPDLNGLAERATKEVTLGSFCTVFTATEILARIRAGEKVEDIVRGAFRSVVKRILEMDTVDGALVMTGGVVAHNPYLATLVEESFGQPVLVPPDPQYVGALGAALFALDGAQAGEAPCS